MRKFSYLMYPLGHRWPIGLSDNDDIEHVIHGIHGIGLADFRRLLIYLLNFEIPRYRESIH